MQCKPTTHNSYCKILFGSYSNVCTLFTRHYWLIGNKVFQVLYFRTQCDQKIAGEYN